MIDLNQNNFKIVPQGGNTGLVGGQIPMGEVLISLTKMKKIREVSKINNSMIVEAGATLQEVHNAANIFDRHFPLFLSSQGSCTIGGNLSTNAGGNHVLKYGTTRDLVFGVEAVLANGDVYNGLTNLKKDNTGYDLSKLIAGSFGTLVALTEITLKVLPKKESSNTIAIYIDKHDEIFDLLIKLSGSSSEISGAVYIPNKSNDEDFLNKKNCVLKLNDIKSNTSFLAFRVEGDKISIKEKIKNLSELIKLI